MTVEYLYRMAMFVALFLAQVLVLNHIHLFDVATPLLYVYFVITFRRNTPRWVVLLWSFAMGLVLDVYSNTPGLAAGTLTLIGLVQPYLLELVMPRDSAENLKSSAATLGLGNFALLCTVLTTVYCLIFFALEAFTFFDWLVWMERAISSAVLTLILIVAIESIRSA